MNKCEERNEFVIYRVSSLHLSTNVNTSSTGTTRQRDGAHQTESLCVSVLKH